MRNHAKRFRVRVACDDPGTEQLACDCLARLGFEVTVAGEFAGLRMAEVERRVILQALHAHGGNRAATARALGLCEKTIYNRMKRYRL